MEPESSPAVELPEDLQEKYPWLHELRVGFEAGLDHAGTTMKLTDDLFHIMVDVAAKQFINGLSLGVHHTSSRLVGAEFDEDAFRESLSVPDMTDAVKSAIRAGERGYGPAVRYIRQSAVVRAWAGLEALSEDMWAGALDQGPAAVRAGAVAKAGKVKVQLSELAAYDFDVRASVGRMLVRAGNLTFGTAEGIQRSYDEGFGWSRMCPKLQEVAKLQLVEKRRHLIVHRGGFVDKEYREFLRGHQGHLDLPALGSQLTISRKEATAHLHLVDFEGMKLIENMYYFLDHHSPKPNA